jgi:DNA-binding MarR family transcriptional regulator
MNRMNTRLETFLPYRLAAAAEVFSRNLVAVYGRKYGLSREEWRLLFLLADCESLTSLALTQRATLDKVQISRASQRLEDKGLITRQVAPTDRRLRLFTCTDKGRALFREILPEVEARAQKIFDTMSESDSNALKQGLAALFKAVQSVEDADHVDVTEA